jgi:hypothetical protein
MNKVAGSPGWNRGKRVVPISVLDLQSLVSGPAVKTFV